MTTMFEKLTSGKRLGYGGTRSHYRKKIALPVNLAALSTDASFRESPPDGRLNLTCKWRRPLSGDANRARKLIISLRVFHPAPPFIVKFL